MTVPRLTLGWRLNASGDPDYWVQRDSKIGCHDARHLMTISADRLRKHTAIVAQSGSGKSFLLGRLIEELSTMTGAKCLVLDPNGDYIRINSVNPSEDIWEKPNYDPARRRGRFTHEKTKKEFVDRWSQVKKRIRKPASPTGGRVNGIVKRLQVPWFDVSADLLSADIDPLLRHEVANCHRIFQSLSQFTTIDGAADLLDKSEEILNAYSEVKEETLRSTLEREFRLDGADR